MQISFLKNSRNDISRVLYRQKPVSVIYLDLRSPVDSSSLPPGKRRAILICRYIWPCNSWDVRPPVSPSEPVGSYPTFSPLLSCDSGSFLSLIPDVTAGFPLGNMVPCVARTFLPGVPGRQTSFLPLILSYFKSFLFCSINFIIISTTVWSSRREVSMLR